MSVTYIQVFAGNDSEKKPIQKTALNKLQVDFEMSNELIEFYFSSLVFGTLSESAVGVHLKEEERIGLKFSMEIFIIR